MKMGTTVAVCLILVVAAVASCTPNVSGPTSTLQPTVSAPTATVAQAANAPAKAAWETPRRERTAATSFAFMGAGGSRSTSRTVNFRAPWW